MNTKIKNVLLIEDDEPTIFLTKLIFESIDFVENINACYDGNEAIQFLNQTGTELPELILLDINMPGMDGWEFLEYFNKIDLANKENIKIFMLTTSIFEEDKQKALKNKNISGFLNKPLTINSLENIFKKIA